MRVIRFYKPYGVLCKFTDAAGRSTLADYIDVPDVYPAGRLDMDSEGLVLLTDYGALNSRLTEPKYAHPRTYIVQVEREPDDEALAQLRAGVVVKKRKTRPAEVERLAKPPNWPYRELPPKYEKAVPTAFLKLTLREGRNRQVRRMTAAVGHPTLRLVRVAVGPVQLEGLAPGEWCDLSEEERQALWQSVGLKG